MAPCVTILTETCDLPGSAAAGHINVNEVKFRSNWWLRITWLHLLESLVKNGVIKMVNYMYSPSIIMAHDHQHKYNRNIEGHNLRQLGSLTMPNFLIFLFIQFLTHVWSLLRWYDIHTGALKLADLEDVFSSKDCQQQMDPIHFYIWQQELCLSLHFDFLSHLLCIHQLVRQQ